MPRGKKKYQITALMLPVVLAINLVIPSALFAANFFCESNPDPEVNATNTVADCCSEFHLNSVTVPSDDQEQIDYCTFEQTCKQSISVLFTELQTILPVEKHVYAASATSTISIPVPDDNIFSYISLGSSLLYQTPPIYLLNSAFLN